MNTHVFVCLYSERVSSGFHGVPFIEQHFVKALFHGDELDCALWFMRSDKCLDPTKEQWTTSSH